MNIILSLRKEPKHQRIDISAPEYQPSGIRIEVTSGEKKLIEMFRDLEETGKNQVLEEMTAISKATRWKRRCERNDAERAGRKNAV